VLVSWYSNNLEPLPVLGSTANEQIAFSLRNQRNEIITNESLKNKITVTDFFFTIVPAFARK
jgi:cytochrome oxidase Cu insertion factor (SCO1/SenC/PrrC family)